MIIVSCITKFHAFALAEQLHKHRQLSGLYTSYSYAKNTIFRNFVKRIDKEKIPVELINTNLNIAIGLKLLKDNFLWSTKFDEWVAAKISKRNDYKVFVGWSSMSLKSISVAKAAKKVTILERGSSHILYQEKILKEEYALRGQLFQIDPRIVDMELKEYELADYISIPSGFVRDSFLEYGVSSSKLIQNPYGVSSYFKPSLITSQNNKFRILYLGTLSIRKGLLYFFDALKLMPLDLDKYEVVFIGSIDDSIKPFLDETPSNWKFLGHINHYELSKHIEDCDVAVHPSLEEGLSTVILQLLASGIPVIATENTGAADIIKHKVSGYIIPPRSVEAIREALLELFYQPELLKYMKANVSQAVNKEFTWDDYGNRYINAVKEKLDLYNN